MKMKVKVINENDKSVTKYNVEICDSRCCKLKFPYRWIPIFMTVVSILSGAYLAYIGIFKESMKIENIILPAIFMVSAIVSGLVALKLIKPFAKMAFLGKIMQCSKCMICCDLCDDDNSNKNQTQGNKSKKDNTDKNDGKDDASDNQQDRGSQNENNEPDEREGSETQGGDNSNSGSQPKDNKDDEPSNIAKAKLDAEKDLIKKFCDTLVEL